MKALVTGGGGFLGRAVVAELARRGHEVTSASRGEHPALAELGARSVVADLADADAVRRAVAGHDVVFHVAARTGVWGAHAEFQRTNVLGTRNVLAACLREGVRRLVHTSSPSVCFSGEGHRGATNELPYAERFLCAYPETKANAERLVLAANGPRLSTCALRPHLIVGPGDPHLLPRLVERARRGRLVVVGDGANEVTLTYVDNAAAAHVDAAETLLARGPEAACAGRAYFIGQKEPVLLWRWIDELFARVGLPPLRRRVPRALAYAGGGALELVWGALRLKGEPPMTRFVAQQLALSHSYDLGPAERDLGYRERVPLAEANERIADWVRATWFASGRLG